MNFESNKEDKSSGKKRQLKIFQHGSLSRVCIRAAYAFVTVLKLFILTWYIYMFYFEI